MKHIAVSVLAIGLLIGSFPVAPFLQAPVRQAQAATLDVPLTVRETTGIARTGEIVQAGVPLPKESNFRDAGSFAVLDAAGRAVPAEFDVTARWGSGAGDTAAPIQWVLVSFPATVSARGTATYRLTVGSNIRPATAISLQKNGNQVTVNTGIAQFTVGENSLFDSVDRGGAKLVSGGSMALTIENQNGQAAAIRSVSIEREGPLSAVVVVKGTYSVTFGGAPLSFTRRYEFEAGSPTAIVRHVITWEGSFSGNSWWAAGKTPTGYNLVQGSRIRDTLNLGFTPSSGVVVSSFDSTVERPAGQELALRTRLKEKTGTTPARFEPRLYQVLSGSSVIESGSRTYLGAGKMADGGVIAAKGPNGTLAVAINHMQNYEPQALRLLPNGSIAIDVADDKFRLASYQGLFATMAVSALPGGASRADFDKEVWAPLNHPLRALPSVDWVNSTGAINPIPAPGKVAADIASYESKIPQLLQNTLTQAEREGLHGLVTAGLWPRYWAETASTPLKPAGEIGNGTWDSVFMDTTWTDYYSTSATADIWALRSGDSTYIDELAAPAALRSLHTQIIQGGPNSTNWYTGQGVAGYGGYRSDFNSKHHYWDNLYLYYFLTGDETVTDIITQGGRAQRERYLAGRGGVNGAVSALWMMSWRFLGTAAKDPTDAAKFTATFKKAVEELITVHYAELAYNGKTYGFISDDAAASGFTMDSPWTLAGFDMENVYWYMKMTGDAPVGPNAIRPSRVLKNLAKSFVEILPSPTLKNADGTFLGGDGTISGKWARSIKVTYSGPQIGGTASSIIAVEQASQPLLFSGDKPFMSSFLSRASALGADASVKAMSRSLVLYALGRVTDKSVFGKLGGLGTHNLHVAVAEESGLGSITPPPPTVENLIVSGVAAAGDFTQTSDCSAAIVPGKSCTVRVKFLPTVAGPRTGTLTLTYNKAGSPRTVALRGIGLSATTSAPTLSLSASPNPVASGSASTLVWSSTQASSCEASGGWSGAKAVSGSVSSGILAATTTYRLSCSGTGGTIAKEVSIGVRTNPEPIPTAAAVTGFMLVNADTDADIRPLVSGSVIDLTALPTKRVNIRAITNSAPIGSVQFGLDGNDRYMVERTAPFSLAGDDSGDYKPWTPSAGSHDLRATPWSEADARGQAGTPYSIQFSVQDGGSTPPPAEQLPPAALSFPFNEGSGTTAAAEQGGIAQLKGGATWTTGKLGMALKLGGPSMYAELSGSSVPNLSNDGGAVAAWFRMDASSLGQNRMFPIVWKRSSTNSQVQAGYSLFAHQSGPNDKPYLRVRLGTGSTGSAYDDLKSTKTQLAAGTWYHAVLTWNSSTVYLYLNGQLEATGPRQQTFSNNQTMPLLIGNMYNGLVGTQEYANGAIDEVRLYDRTLSPSEASQLGSSGQVRGIFTDWRQEIMDTIGAAIARISGSVRQIAATIASLAGFETEPSVTIQPSAVDFGSIPVGSASGEQLVTISYGTSTTAGATATVTVTASDPMTAGAISTVSAVSSAQSSASDGGAFIRDLDLGMQGEDVRTLQRVLNAEGFKVANAGEGSPGKEGTYFGYGTKRALAVFQEKYRAELLTIEGLSRGDGVFRGATRQKIETIRKNRGL
jgi:hypothetical protein